jgi:hypothetical protein
MSHTSAARSSRRVTLSIIFPLDPLSSRVDVHVAHAWDSTSISNRTPTNEVNLFIGIGMLVRIKWTFDGVIVAPVGPRRKQNKNDRK